MAKLKYVVDELLEAKIFVMVDVMEELGLVSTSGAFDERTITLLSSGKVELENSKILNNLKSKAATL